MLKNEFIDAKLRYKDPNRVEANLLTVPGSDGGQNTDRASSDNNPTSKFNSQTDKGQG